jgi:hypothetical protein
MSKLTGGNKAKAFWIDSNNGESKAIGQFANSGVQSFSTPEGWEGALLILEGAGDYCISQK